MSATPHERVAVLAVRAWFEHAGPAGFRARIQWVEDLAVDVEHTAVASSPEGVIEIVQQWLTACGASPSSPRTPLE
jgi:hypothetical protein